MASAPRQHLTDSTKERLFVAFRSAKEAFFAERKATITPSHGESETNSPAFGMCAGETEDKVLALEND